MPHFVDELRAEAEAAIAAMQTAALTARNAHARAELMRHMLTTARKVMHKPKDEAIETVVREWMAAWNLTRTEWPQLQQSMVEFTAAFHDFAHDASDRNDLRLRKSCAALDTALANEGTTIAEQMAWRSQCAHGWWEMVAPTPTDLAGAKPRPSIPPIEAGKPFWETGCADFCR